jgi:hypothetical protein
MLAFPPPPERSAIRGRQEGVPIRTPERSDEPRRRVRRIGAIPLAVCVTIIAAIVNFQESHKGHSPESAHDLYTWTWDTGTLIPLSALCLGIGWLTWPKSRGPAGGREKLKKWVIGGLIAGAATGFGIVLFLHIRDGVLKTMWAYPLTALYLAFPGAAIGLLCGLAVALIWRGRS